MDWGDPPLGKTGRNSEKDGVITKKEGQKLLL